MQKGLGVGRLLVEPMTPLRLDDEETGFERLSLDMPQADADLLARFAAYRNALAAAQGKKLRKRWTRKSIAEHLLHIQLEGLLQQLSDMIEAVGPLPSADTKDIAKMEEYARAVLKWERKHTPK